MFLIKPDAFRRMEVGNILKFIEGNLEIIDMEFFRFTPELVDEFYAEHKEKDFYGRLQATMISGFSLAILVQENWEQSHKGLSDMIREKIGIGFNPAENGVHCSDSFDAAIRESDLVFGRHS